MASNINQAPAFMVMALILFAAANPLSHAQATLRIDQRLVALFLAEIISVEVNDVLPDVVNDVQVPGVVSGLKVSGQLCSTANGNCSAGASGIAGVAVKLSCTSILGAAVTAGQSTTGATGGFNITISNLLSTLGGALNPNSPIPCNVIFSLPLNQTLSCPILSSVSRLLTGAVSTVLSVTSGAVGLIGTPECNV